MTRQVKIALWAGGLLTLSISSILTYQAVRRRQIRKRLETAFANPLSVEAAGGMNKLLVAELFDKRTHQISGKATISRVEARERAKEIWDNYGAYFWSSNDTSAILSAFDKLGHAHDISKMADEFYQSYGEELFTALETAFEDQTAQQNILIGKLMQLPTT